MMTFCRGLCFKVSYDLPFLPGEGINQQYRSTGYT